MRLLSLILFFTLCFQVSAQGDFERLTTLDGLSQNDVYFIFQDSKGFMWFGTADGLNRYDGLSFTTYQRTSLMDHPILSNIPFCMTEDSQGNLWIGTSDAGVWLFNRHKEAFTQVPIYFEGNKIISNHNTFGLLIDAENNLWIGSTQGISVFNINDYYQGKYTGAVLEHWPDKLGIKKNQQTLSINYIEKDLQGNVLVGTALGIFNATFDTKKIDINHIDILSKYKSTSLAKTKRGYLVSCYSGIYYYQKNNDGSHIEKKVSDEFLKTLKVAKNGSIWGGGTKGLFHYTFDDTSLELKLVNSFTHDSNSSSLSRNNVVCIFEDNSGLLWIGTKSGGVNKLVLNKKKFKQFTLNTKHSDITNSKISAFLEDKKGNLWIGTEGEGFFILPQKESTNLPSHFINYSISSNIFHQDNVYSIAEIPNSLNKTSYNFV